jgi:hypothetical protein
MASILQRQVSHSSSDNESDVECPLSGSEALALCKAFAARTKTDTGLAMMLLQQNAWNLDQALCAYQRPTSGKSVKSKKECDGKRLKILSCNIDGLDQHTHTVEVRTRGVIDVIRR